MSEVPDAFLMVVSTSAVLCLRYQMLCCWLCTLDTSRFLVLRLSWLVLCRLGPNILETWVGLKMMSVTVRLLLLWVVCWMVLVLESREMLPLRLLEFVQYSV